MRIADRQITETVRTLIDDVGRSPFLFLGSGFSRRYLNTDDWEGLLRAICAFYSDDEFLYDKYRLKVDSAGSISPNPAIASLMERDLRAAILGDPKYKDFRDAHASSIRSGDSILKVVAANRILGFADRANTEELAILQEAGKRRVTGVITTNYDGLIESLFPGFTVFVGQEDLLFQQLYEVGEIYKIHGSAASPQTMVLTEEDYGRLKEQTSYLAAKLLTIFVEYPIIFMGYSIGDPDIRAILCSLAACLSEQHLEKLANRFIFVTRGDNAIATHTLEFADGGQIQMQSIATNDFGLIYKGIGASKSRLSPRVIREVKRNIYDLVLTSEGNPRMAVMGLDRFDEVPEGMLIGLGPVAKDEMRYGHIVKPEQLYLDVIFDDQFLNPSLVIEEYLPDKLPSNSRGLPMYKYLEKYHKEIQDPNILKHIESNKCVNDFLHGQQRRWKEAYRKKHPSLSVDFVIETEGREKAYDKLLFLEPEEIDLEEMRVYIANLLRENPEVLKDNSELKRLIRVYDYLRYKNAPSTAANSEQT